MKKIKNIIAVIALACGIGLFSENTSVANNSLPEGCFYVDLVTTCGTFRCFRACSISSAFIQADIYDIVDCGLN